MITRRPVFLSKSRIMAALQCAKKLHFKVHCPEKEVISANTQNAFDIGNVIGELARSLYATGGSVYIDVPYNEMGKAVAQTEALLRAGHREPIFEATLRHDNVLVRVDALVPEGDGWRIVEVKSSTTVKPEHVPDCAVQAWVCRNHGLDVRCVSLAHVDNTFVYAGDGDYAGLLIEADVTDEVLSQVDNVPDWIRHARAAAGSEMPNVPVGRQCCVPYECSFFAQCWPIDTRYPIYGLADRKEKHFELVNAGFRDITEVPEDLLSLATHRRIHRVTRSGEPEILDGAREFFGQLAFPRYYLDFESVQPGIPIWPGTRPYQQLPVQYSLHIERAAGGLEHRAFLDLSGEPPMRALAEQLITALEDSGPVLMYTNIEKRMIDVLKGLHCDLRPALDAIARRLVDIQPPVRSNYYHPDMLGSWSIKAVLPTIAPGLNHADLEEIGEGMAASNAFVEAIHPDTPAERREDLRGKLLEYCRLDTLAMVRLVHFFEHGTQEAARLAASP